MKKPLYSPIYANQYQLGGTFGQFVEAISEQWLLVAPKANPAMLEMFSDRDNPPYRNQMPWAGEFAGKYLTSAVQVLRLSRDPHLKTWIEKFIGRLIELQDTDGYLGPWPKDSRLTNFSAHHGEKGLPTWDTWGHYHIMTGLLYWYEETGDQEALQCVERIADLLCQMYLGDKPVRLVETGSTEMNLAPVHALARLYQLTGVQRYLKMALQIVDEFAVEDENGPLAGDYLRLSLAGKALYEMPRPRWESLHAILGLAELYWITGEESYRQAFEQVWWGIVENDRHNNGGFSSGEQATGNPYHQGTIETCCTIAWIALSVEMLKMTGSSIVADEIELSSLNSVLGMHSPSGRWATFTTPMDGARFANAQAIVFQSRSGSPELNCCSVNSPRGIGMLSEWAVMRFSDETHRDGIVLNYYGPCKLETALADGTRLNLVQETDYPWSNRVRIHVLPEGETEFSLRLRIPYWSQRTRLTLNGQEMEGGSAGGYFEIPRSWQPEDVLTLEFDFSLHFWHGERECEGLVSVFRGPVLLAYDQRYNRSPGIQDETRRIPDDPFKVTRGYLTPPEIEPERLTLTVSIYDGWHAPNLLVQSHDAEGKPIFLCDFASAGMTGSLYRTWLMAAQPKPTAPFSRDFPLRSAREG